MKILMIAPQPFLEPRGTPISVYQRLQGLSSLGHKIDFLTYHIGEDITLPGVTLIRIPRVPFIKKLRVGPSWSKVPLDLMLIFKAIALLLGNQYDVIHSHEEAAFFSVFLAALFRTRHLYDMHSSLPKQLVNFNFGSTRLMIKLFEWMERYVIRSSDAVITIGPDLEEHVRKIRPDVRQMMIENLPLISNADPVDPAALGELRQQLGIENRLAVVYTGTFERYQGVDVLIESARIVRDQHPEVAFILVGGNPQQIQEMKELVARLGLERTVTFTGTVPVDDANKYLEMADIIVSPRIEGTSVPLKIYTYLQAGKPIVATRLTAHTLVLDEKTAVLVEPDKESFAEGFLKLICDPELRQSLAQQAQHLAREKYCAPIYLGKLEQIYKVFQTANPGKINQADQYLNVKH